MAVEQKRFSRRRTIREERNPTGEPKVASEAPQLEELEIGPAVVAETAPEPEEDLAVELEHPPGPAVMWQRIRSIEKKVEYLYLRAKNQSRSGGVTITTWKCKGSPDKPHEGCDFTMESTPPGMPKQPELICPKHGRVPFDPVS
jgi:hypothetical protein